MCYSMEASFAASITLTGFAYVSNRVAQNSDEKILAKVPYLFAIQQGLEGIIWIYLDKGAENLWHIKPFVYAWLLFALGIWPFFIPYSVYRVEKNPKIKKFQKISYLLGLAIGLSLLSWAFIHPIEAKISCYFAKPYCGSVLYVYEIISPKILQWLYFLTTCLAVLLSTYTGLRFLGILIGISFYFSYTVYAYVYTSMWCFFVAWVSSLILLCLYFNKKRLDRQGQISALKSTV